MKYVLFKLYYTLFCEGGFQLYEGKKIEDKYNIFFKREQSLCEFLVSPLREMKLLLLAMLNILFSEYIHHNLFENNI